MNPRRLERLLAKAAQAQAQVPTLRELQAARQIFETQESRAIFYRAAAELADLAMSGGKALAVAGALGVLLQAWNKMYYKYTPFDGDHLAEIERLIRSQQQVLERLRQRSIESFAREDVAKVMRVFRRFEQVLGPVGAAKSLHLLAPRFFPLWDRRIAEHYDLPIQQRGRNAEQYCIFMGIVKKQSEALGGEQALGRNPIKAIDEYNYCKYTKGWM